MATSSGYRVDADDVYLSAVIRELGRVGGLRIALDPKLDRKVTLHLQAASAEDILKSVSSGQAFVYEKINGVDTLTSASVASKQAAVSSKNFEKPATHSLGKGRLTNSDKGVAALRSRSSKAILLQNAIIETEVSDLSSSLIDVPEEFRASPDTQNHIVQFDHAISDADRATLEQAGATISHYVPNNAYAVKADAETISVIRALPGIQHIEPFHPYFKMSEDVLAYFTDQASDKAKSRIEKGEFNLMTFRGVEDLSSLEQAGVTVKGSQTVDGRKIVIVECTASEVPALLKNEIVQWVETKVKPTPSNDLANRRIRATSFKRLHPSLTGEGVIVSVNDTGIDFMNQGFADNPSLPTSTGLNSRITYYESRAGGATSDGIPGDNEGHGTHVSGSIAGNGALSQSVPAAPGSGTAPYTTNQFAGVAPRAKLVVLEDFNSFDQNELTSIPYSKGARIQNNSWGTSDAGIFEYGTLSAVWDSLVIDADTNAAGEQAMITLFSAGNAGAGVDDGTGGVPGTIGQPGNSKNVITVGSVEQPRYADNLPGADVGTDSDWQISSFSSRGPVSTTDVRIKPEIVAPGSYVLSVQSRETFPDDLLDPFLPNRDYRYGNLNSGTNFAFLSGTSMATPIVAGGAALVFEHYTNTYGVVPSPAVMKALLVVGARMVNSVLYKLPYDSQLTAQVDQGFGLLDVRRAVEGPEIHDSDQLLILEEDDTTPLATGETFQQQVTVGANEGGLKIALVWTDPAGTPGNAKQLVNDLDLVILPPGGGAYFGNQFDLDGVHSRKFASANLAFGDEDNNVETVLIKDAPIGTYTIRVVGFAVADGPQDYALVIMKGTGIEGRTEGDRPSVTLDTNDLPVVAYSDVDDGGSRQIFVKKWVGPYGDESDLNTWRRLDDQWFGMRNSASLTGISRSLEPSRDPSVSIHGTNIFVAWVQEPNAFDTSTPDRIYMRKFDGSDWVELNNSAHGTGISGVQTYDAEDPVMEVVRSLGFPIVGWRQNVLTGTKVYVAIHDGANWVGLNGSSSTGLSGSVVASFDMIVDSLGFPVVAMEEQTTQKIQVRRWNGAAWADLGAQGLAPYAGKPSLAAGDNGEIFLAWEQTPNGVGSNFYDQIYVSKFQSGVWSQLGGSTNPPGISFSTSSTTRTRSPKIDVGPNGLPIVSWQSGTNANNPILVRRFNGVTWVGLAGSDTTPGISRNSGVSTQPDMVVDSKNLPVIAFQNTGSGADEVLTYTIVSDRNPPNFGGLVTATGGTNLNVNLSWVAAVDDLSTTIIYRIYRGTQTFACGTTPTCNEPAVFSNLIATVTNVTTFNVTGLANGLVYCFGVRAGDTNGLFELNQVVRSAGPVTGAGDNDSDCLANNIEVAIGTEPCIKDTDGDGMEDGWEWTYSTNNPAHPSFTNPAALHLDPLDNGTDRVRTLASNDGNEDQLPEADIDGDGASAGEEHQWWLQFTHIAGFCEAGSPTNRISPDPTKADTDGDGIPDGWEIFNALNPTVAGDALTDLDGDGINNLQEYQNGSDPRNTDSDGDGVLDGAEVLTHFTNPALADTDRDGLDDGFELQIGSNPRDADSNDSLVSDGDVYQLGLNPTGAASNLRVFLNETFEASSTTRSAWTHYAPNAALPFDFWHLTTAEPSPKSNTIAYIDDHSTSTAYRAALDPTKTNVNATYHIGSAVIMALQSPALTNAVVSTNLFVSWNEWFETEAGQDFVQLQARGGTSTNWVNVSPSLSGKSGITNANDASSAIWATRVADISAFAGYTNVQVRFLFNVINNFNNSYKGWWVDDVRVYEGVTIRGWVRDNNGRAVQGARVYALGRGGVTNAIFGHKYINPGKIFADSFTAADGSYQMKGLPQGNYYLKATSSGHIDEFYNGQLFTGVYAFASGFRPGVPLRDQVTTNGVVSLLSPGALTNVHFELERGGGRGLLGVALPGAASTNLPVFVDGRMARVWNGLTNGSAAFTTYVASVTASITNNRPDWLTNAVRPTLLGDVAPGDHRPYVGTNLVLYPLPEVNIREGETTILALSTNQASGRLFVTVTGSSLSSIRVDGQAVTNLTPALLTLTAGPHEVVPVVTGSTRRVAPKRAIVPVGGRVGITFSAAEVSGAAGMLDIRTTDVNGNVVTGASIFISGSAVTTNDVSASASLTTPTVLTSLLPGQHRITVAKNGYQPSENRTVTIFAGVTNLQTFVLYTSDEEYDRVGDSTEVLGYTNVFLYHRDNDPDADGLSNLFEFDVFRLFNVLANPFAADTDGDGMLDGDEVSYNGVSNSIALTTLDTNIVQFATYARLKFVGSYLAGSDNFGSGVKPVSVEGDRFEGLVVHPLVTVPNADPALTVITNIPSFPSDKAIGVGHATGREALADGIPDRLDSDGDTMWDGFEFQFGLSTVAMLDVIEAARADEDPDSDGLSNANEFLGPNYVADTNWTSAISSDTDGDAMPDGWEYEYALNPLDPVDAFEDVDGDGLINLGEFLVGTHPTLADTDADGLNDFADVVTFGSNPTDPDTDGDGLLDGQEVWDRNLDGVQDGGFFPNWNGADLDNDGSIDGPTDWDTDGDGMPDGFEVLNSLGQIREPTLNPYDPTDGNEDADGDGLSNLEEYLVRDALFGNHPGSFSLFNFSWYGPVQATWVFATKPYAPEYPVWDYATDPFDSDTDDDGMPDGYEVVNGLHPADPIAVNGNTLVRFEPLSIYGDPDHDGLWNDLEFKVRFALDGSASTNALVGLSTHPWRTDSDGDGVSDGDEHHAMLSSPVLQDTDGDRLMDGTALTNTWGEVESRLRHRFEVIDCPGCTWLDAYFDAQAIASPDDPTVAGHLASVASSREMLDVMAAVSAGTGTNLAIGAFDNPRDGIFSYLTAGASYAPMAFQFFGTNLPPVLPPAETNGFGVGIGTNGVFSAVIWTNPVYDSYVIEWETATVETNHFDGAFNDIWALGFANDAGLGAPYWVKVQVDTNSALPPARWGHTMTYVPGYEIKDQRDGKDPHLGEGTHILLDNRKLVVIGGRDGAERHSDVWEYWIKSNQWTLVTTSLVDAASSSHFQPELASGISEHQAILLMGYSNTKNPLCDTQDKSYNADGISFGEPKNRPWDNGYQDSSYDLTYILGGWNDDRWYGFNEPLDTIYYKSSDDLNDIVEESKAYNNNVGSHDVWQSTESRVSVVISNGASAGTTDNRSRTYADLSVKFEERTSLEDGGSNERVPLGRAGSGLVPVMVATTENLRVSTFATNVATAIRIDKFPFKFPCDRLVLAELVIEVTDAPTNDLDLFIRSEFNQGLENPASEQYQWDEEEQSVPTGSPLERAAGRSFVSTNSTQFTIPAGFTGELPIDVTVVLQEVILSPAWEGRAVGFVITNDVAETESALMKENSAFLRITHNPSYRVPPQWHVGTRLQTGEVEVPSQRKSFGMVYDYVNERIVVFGGMNGRQVFGETYEGVPIFGEEDEEIPLGQAISDNNDVRKVRLVRWIRNFPEVAPSPRWGHSMVYDDVNERIVLFGGFDKDNQPLNDLWAYYVGTPVTNSVVDTNGVTNVTVDVSASRWEEIVDFQDNQRPSPRGGAGMVFAGGHFYERGAGESYRTGKRDKIVIFGGTDGKTYFNDTWYYDEEEDHQDIVTTNKSRWVLADPGGEQSQGPDPRAFATMVYAQNGGLSPDLLGLGTFARIDADSVRRASATVYLFGGRRGTLPTAKDSDRDLVDDGQEFELGGVAAGRDPRVNALYNSSNGVETVPYSIKKLGTWQGALPIPRRPAVADLEALSYQERLHGFRMGSGYGKNYMPWQGYPLETTHTNEYYNIGDETQFPVEEPNSNRFVYITGVDAYSADWTNMWFHRHGVGDPQDNRDVWQLGRPDNSAVGTNGAPPYAYSGRWVYGTDLDGSYPNNALMELYSPIFDLKLPSLTSTDTNNLNSFFLLFHEWVDLADPNDVIKVDIVRPSTPADIATRVAGLDRPDIPILPPRNNQANTHGKWRRVVTPIEIAGNQSNLYLRFTMQTDTNGVAGGWYIDDIAILQGNEIHGSNGLGQVELLGENFNNNVQATTTANGGLFDFGFLPLGNYQIVSAGLTNGPFVLAGPELDVDVQPFAPPEFTAVAGTLPVVITWTAEDMIAYRVDRTTNLMGGVWTPIGVVTGGVSPTASFTDIFATVETYYRVAATNLP